ncbi:hypothetical protein C5L14_02730 [Labrys okinawensis]|uniref:Uncharacterized protein n=1 Tax=Labrys okinawensis TaxID=346911 RepID=A0A2S9QJI0_9HYPH|nr:hypothetical protein [Labrys okinawensis]PRH89505.1 hypothetical protein C5L14_02730 [Labrys okinawensis]
MRIAFALSCAGLIACFGIAPALADGANCSDIKRALVSANMDFMRIERGALPVAPAQAALVIGQMSALTQLTKLACEEEDARQIAKVVGVRLRALQELLPIGSAPAEVAEAPETPPAPPPAPPSEARRQAARKPTSAVGCHRIYYTRDGHRYWRCQR